MNFIKLILPKKIDDKFSNLAYKIVTFLIFTSCLLFLIGIGASIFYLIKGDIVFPEFLGIFAGIIVSLLTIIMFIKFFYTGLIEFFNILDSFNLMNFKIIYIFIGIYIISFAITRNFLDSIGTFIVYSLAFFMIGIVYGLSKSNKSNKNSQSNRDENNEK